MNTKDYFFSPNEDFKQSRVICGDLLLARDLVYVPVTRVGPQSGGAMKKVAFGLVVALAMAVAPAHGATVVVRDWDASYGNNGQIPAGQPNAGGLGGAFLAQTSDAGSFITYCLEVTESVELATKTYDYTVSDHAVRGGYGPDPMPVEGDALSAATKWLYYQVRFGSMYQDKLGAVQLAIWKLEDELGDYGLAGDALSIYTEALAGNWNALDAAGHRVRVMNLTFGSPTDSNYHRQSMLTHEQVPVAEPASLLLLGSGLLGLAARLRRRQR